MAHTTINPAIADSEQILAIAEAYRESGTSKPLNEYITFGNEICPIAKSYLKGKFSCDESRIFDIEMDFFDEIFLVLERRAEQMLKRSGSLTFYFASWVSGAFEGVTSTMHQALLGAFEGNMIPVDKAIEMYMKSPIAKEYS